MKKVNSVDKVYLADYDVNVEQYLTYAQIQTIANSVKKLDSWSARQQNIDMLVLAFATDIDHKELENYKHDHWLKCGLIEAVTDKIKNLSQIDSAINYEESPMRILMQISKEMPEFSKKVDEVMKNAPSKK